MGSLFEELEAREAAARVRVEELEAELAAVSARLEKAREGLERLRITRETVAEVLGEMTPRRPLRRRPRVSRLWVTGWSLPMPGSRGR